VLHVDLQPGATPAGPPARYYHVALTDGSLLHATAFRPKGKTVELPLAPSDAPGKNSLVVQVPLAAVAYVLSDAHDAAIRQEWQAKYLARRGNEDILAIKTAKGVQRLEGTFGDGTENGEKIEFLVRQKSYAIDLNIVHGLVFFRRADAEAPTPACRVQDVYKNTLAASRVELSGENVVVTTTAGTKLTYPRPLVHRLDYSRDKLAFLSDLEPLVEKAPTGRLEESHYFRDQNVEKEPLRLGGQRYAKGLALFAVTSLAYDLGGRYREFKAVAGVDDKAGGDSHAVLMIEGDGRELFSGTFTQKDKPQPLTLDIKGVRQLRVLVRSARLVPYETHLDLADARVSK